MVSHADEEIRQLRFRQFHHLYDVDIVKKTLNLVSSPVNQIAVILGKSTPQPSNTMNHFLSGLNYEFAALSFANIVQFVKVMQRTSRLRVKNLVIAFNGDESEDLVFESFTKVVDCQELFLHLFLHFQDQPIRIPYFPKLKCLLLDDFNMIPDIERSILDYCLTLHDLTISNCSITDVSMLGSIPSLALRYCHQLVDISALNNNDTVIIENCNKIEDYSRSFANSREIIMSRIVAEVTSSSHRFYFDMTRWKQVEVLSLGAYSAEEVIFINNQNQLPKTVKTCYLEGEFVSTVNFTVTSDHVLNEIKFINSHSFKTIEGYGLEHVRKVDFHGIKSLETLQGLGRGSNQKISIHYCDKITDFSPVGHLPMVKIVRCVGFTDPLQVRFVRDLTVLPVTEISFQSNLIPHHPYRHIHSLSLESTRSKYVISFDGLERIPELQLDYHGYQLLRDFLEKGQQLQNRRIVVSCGECYDTEVLDHLHHGFLKDRYDCYDNLKKKWIWTRKVFLETY